MSSAFSDFVSLFFPESCMGCSSGLVKGEEILCTRCITELPRTGYLDYECNPVKEKFVGRLPLKNGWAFLRFRKSGIVQHLLHQLKYCNQPEIGFRLGKLFGKEMKDRGFDSAFDMIIPLPLYASRLRTRGYNQSVKIAEGMSDSLQVPVESTVCSRQKNTQTQTKKTKLQRWENVQEAFVVDPMTLANKRVLLVDDVITTGATIEACGWQIINSGCRELSVACLAEAQ